MNMLILLFGLLCNTASAEDSLRGSAMAKTMLPMNAIGGGLIGLSTVLTATSSNTVYGPSNLGVIITTFSLGTLSLGGGTTVGLVATNRMVRDLGFKGISVDRMNVKYANASAVLAVGQFLTGFFVGQYTEQYDLSDVLVLTTPLWGIPITYFAVKQNKVTRLAFEESTSAMCDDTSVQSRISLVPSLNGLSLVGTF